MTLADAYAILKTGTLWASGGTKCGNKILGRGFAMSNPGEAAKIDGYVAALARGETPVPPVLATATGRGIVGMLAALTGTTPPAPEPEPPPAPPPSTSLRLYGFANGYHMGTDQQLQQQAGIGAPISRVDCAWSWTEPSRGQYNWAAADAFQARIKAAGCEWLPNLAYTPAWARPAGTTDKQEPLDAFEQDFARYVGAFVARYKPRMVEIWNEQNIQTFWQPKPNPAKYTRMLRLAHAAAKQAHPTVHVIYGGTSPAGSYADPANGLGQANVNPIRYLEACYAHGVGGHFDGLGHHPYWGGVGTMPGIDKHPAAAWYQMYGTTPSLLSVMAANGDAGKPIHATELGCRSRGVDGSNRAYTDQWQAETFTVAATMWRTFPWAGVFCPYIQWEGMNGGDDGFRSYGLCRADGTPKLAWSAYRAAIGG